MQVRFAPLFRLSALVAAALTSFVGCGGEDTPVDQWDIDTQAAFVRVDDAGAVDACSDTGETWATAAATMWVRQNAERTLVEVELTDGRPDTVYTFWLRLLGTDPQTGEAYGSNPITGGGATALAPTADLAALVEATDGAGIPTAPNAFTTDAEGNGMFSVELDFSMVDGAYPFDRYDASLPPADILGPPDAPYMIRMVSHCTDGLTHGLNAGTSENWFDWSP